MAWSFQGDLRRIAGTVSAAGLSGEEIDRLLVLDVKNDAYFSERGVEKQHEGGVLFGEDPEIMGWLFEKRK